MRLKQLLTVPCLVRNRIEMRCFGTHRVHVGRVEDERDAERAEYEAIVDG